MSNQPKTLFEKVWDNHVVVQEDNSPFVLYIDLQLVHEVTSPQAFQGLREKGLTVRRPSQAVATMDHSIPTTDPSIPFQDKIALAQLEMLEKNCAEFGVPLYGWKSDNRGVVHVIGPEMGLTQPGMTVVCGDSHTATHGAFGALAFGIGTSEVEHVLATQTLLQNKPKTMNVVINGELSQSVTGKDIILALIAKIGVGGGTGYVIEYTGSAIRALGMEARMTVCNMSIEGGARAGMIAPDEKTFDYIAGTKFAPKGADWDAAVQNWRQLPSDEGAQYDSTVILNAAAISPMITFGTTPGQGIPIDGAIPDPADISDVNQQNALQKALNYMNLQPGALLAGQDIDVVFIGSCTNGRISDLRQAAEIFKSHKVSKQVRTLVVPGSLLVKQQAEAEGLDKIFTNAGAEWRQPGCSMCIAMNGDQLQPGEYAVSTSNRNFEGRQGKGGRTFLASPLTAAASAISGKVTDPRTMI
jgi:3-isopropylmalate/(R)-2-methylmalate dehydratase large subunit